MSQSPLTIDESSQQLIRDEYLDNWNTLATLIRGGRSLSGRERNCCFLNTASSLSAPGLPGFSDVSAAVGLDLIDDGRGLAVVDWDQDGDLDLWLANRTGPRVRLMCNDLAKDSDFLSLQLEGKSINRDAIGARVELVIEGDAHRHIETVRAGQGFLSQSSKAIHFGMGQNKTISQVRVRWPGQSEIQEYRNLQPNKRYRLVQGENQPLQLPDRQPISIQPGELSSPKPIDTTRIVLSQRRALPKLELRTFTGQPQVLDLNGRQGTLISLWASWCQPCVAELGRLTEQAEQLKSQGLQVMLLSVDEEAEAAKSLLARLKVPFAGGMATESTLQALTQLDREIVYRYRNLPLPCSFLVDAEKNVAVVYKGPVSTDQLRADLDSLNESSPQMVQAAQPFPGKNIAAWFSPGPVNVARAYWEGGYTDEALSELQRSLQSSPSQQERIRALKLMASIAGTQNDRDLQLSALQKLVIELPDNAEAQLQLAAALHRANRADDATADVKKLELAAQRDANLLGLLGQYYMNIGDRATGIQRLQQAALLDPEKTETRMNLAIAYQLDNQTSRAIEQYEALLKGNPDRLDAANNLAWLLAMDPTTTDRRDEAVSLARNACRRTNDAQPTLLDTLAVALAQSGDRVAAAKVLRQAIPLARGRGEFALSDKMSKRLESFD